MERLVVKNFLLLQDVNIEIKKYNFLLGPQASGKSILAKLLYFIYKIPNFIEMDLDNQLKRDEILDSIKDKFKFIFPENLWENKTFEITYYNDDFSIVLKNKINKLKSLEIEICSKYGSTFDSILNITKTIEIENRNKSLEDIIDIKSKDNSTSNSSRISNYLENKLGLKNYFLKGRSIFIPSSRCVYSLLASKPATNAKAFSSDFFLYNFGELYESLKELYENFHDHNIVAKNFNERSEKILKGKYKYEKKTDYLIINDKKVNVKYVSSGQQEILPLLVILGLYAILSYNHKNLNLFDTRYYFIEEPEAHLFPEAQAELMSLFSYIGYESNMPFFITTHSPYLLSVLNNFLYGTKLMDEGKITLDQYIQITKGARPIRTSEVNAFTLVNGTSKSLMDDDGIFIDSNTLDSASTIINDMYDSFIDHVLD